MDSFVIFVSFVVKNFLRLTPCLSEIHITHCVYYV